MTQQYLKYDPLTGNITDNTGLLVASLLGFVPVDAGENAESTSVDDMIKLKNSGFTAEEVIAIKKANL
jgi:hypothetical protein